MPRRALRRAEPPPTTRYAPRHRGSATTRGGSDQAGRDAETRDHARRESEDRVDRREDDAQDRELAFAEPRADAVGRAAEPAADQLPGDVDDVLGNRRDVAEHPRGARSRAAP